MKKNQKIYGIIFQNRLFVEKNSICTIFSPEVGIERAVAYGARAASSKLTEINMVFSSGYFYLYQSREKGLKKVSEYTTVQHRKLIVHNLNKFLHASIWSELILATDGCGGEYQRCFTLLEYALAILEQYHDERIIRLISIRFMWRYILILGLYQDITRCHYCKKQLVDCEWVHILHSNYELACPSCSAEQHQGHSLEMLSHAQWDYLTRGMSQSFEQSITDPMLYERLDILWEYMVQTTTHIIGKQLKSIYVLQESR